ncbi:hypothetical protein IID19_01905 [Patescibacteria group bacterium]|nr:hypothetical protein [Patescibacteria group bacterium]
MLWANFFHIYQPPNWSPRIIRKVVKEAYRPLLVILKKHPAIKITLNINGSLTEQLHEYGFDDVINNIKLLAKRHQIELTGSALYHPLLPLLPTNEITRQIKLNSAINKKYFGRTYNPRGFFPPEMAYSSRVAKVVEKLHFRWILIDEISHNGKRDSTSFDTSYRIKGTKLRVVFRNTIISDHLNFSTPIKKPSIFWQKIAQDDRSHTALVTAMDGEVLGHHRPGLDKLWQVLVTDRVISTITISKLIKEYKTTKSITPRRASWASRAVELKKNIPYLLWDDPSNPIHPDQWELLQRTITLVNKKINHPHYATARELLDKRMASDQFWWASAKPWWSLAIIKRKAKELVAISSLLENKNDWAIKLGNNIIKNSTSWQKKLIFKKTAAKYLKSGVTDRIRFIGGKRISN